MLTTVFPNFIRTIGLAMLTLLSACYVSNVEVISKGEYAPIAGAYVCTNMISGAPKALVMTEKRSGGFFSSSYEYWDNDSPSEVLKLSKITNALFLVQGQMSKADAVKKGYKYEYYFLYISSPDRMVLLVPDLMSQEPILEQKARARNVRIVSISGEMSVYAKLVGNRSDIAAYLADHDINNLTSAADCQKNG